MKQRKLTTPDTWNIIAIIIAVIAIVGGGVWYFNGRTSSQKAFAVKSNGKILVTTSEWATQQAANKQFDQLFPGHELTLNAIVDDKLQYAEAEKRGITCTTEEAAAKLKEGNDALLTIGEAGLKVALFNVESSGHAPIGYSLTPEAERTPTLVDALKALESDPTALEGYRKSCSIGRLYASLAPEGDVRKQNERVSALKSQLRIDAGLEYGSAATPTAAP